MLDTELLLVLLFAVKKRAQPGTTSLFRFVLLPIRRLFLVAEPRNDIKLGLKKSKGHLFKVLLQFSLFFNLNFGPCGTKKWMLDKRQKAHEFLQEHTADSDVFKQFLPFICKELRMQEPSTSEGRHDILQRVLTMETLRVHGPLTKLMRWFSFHECFAFYKNEVWLTKMLMDPSAPPEAGLQEQMLLDPSLESGELSHREELRRLKFSLGSWKLAPLVVTPSSWMRCEVLTRLSDPLWKVYSSRAKHCTTPDDVQNDFVMLGSLCSTNMLF